MDKFNKKIPQVSQLWDRLLSLLFPKTCVLCQKVVDYDTLWCGCMISKCKADVCGFCYRPHSDCLCPSRSFSLLNAPFDYKDGTKNAILQLKKDPDPRIVEHFVKHMLPIIQPFKDQWSISCVVAVPLSSVGWNKKGFNHAGLLAQSLADLLELPYIADALWRRSDSLGQKTLKSEERKKNAQRSYWKNDSVTLPAGCVLLIDDVCTTGATLEACSKELLALGASAVYALTATNSTMDNHS